MLVILRGRIVDVILGCWRYWDVGDVENQDWDVGILGILGGWECWYLKKFGFLDSWGVGLLGYCDVLFCLQVGYRVLLSFIGNLFVQGGNVFFVLGLFFEVLQFFDFIFI